MQADNVLAHDCTSQDQPSTSLSNLPASSHQPPPTQLQPPQSTPPAQAQPPAATETSAATAPHTTSHPPRTHRASTPPTSTHQHKRSRRTTRQHRRSQTSRSDSETYRRRRHQRRRSSASSKRPRRRQQQPSHRVRSKCERASPIRSRSARRCSSGERSPHASRVTLRSRSELGLPNPTAPHQDKWQWRRTALSPQTKRRPQPPRNTEQLSAQFLRTARQQSQQHNSPASSRLAARQPPTPPPPRRRTNTPTKSSSHQRPEQAESEGDETSRPANPQSKQDMRHTVPARPLPPRTKPAMGQQRFWRAMVPKPFCVLREGEKPRPLTYGVAAANQFSHALEELAEGSGLSTDIRQG